MGSLLGIINYLLSDGKWSHVPYTTTLLSAVSTTVDPYITTIVSDGNKAAVPYTA